VSTIYHYTDSSGLIAILTSGSLWASDALYMNDASELEYGRTLAREVLADLLDENHAERSVRRMLLESPVSRQAADRAHICVACLCKDGDLLSQWRGYAGGVGGFAIGLDWHRVEEVVNAQDFEVSPVVYERSEQRSIFRRLLGGWVYRLAEDARREDFDRVLDALMAAPSDVDLDQPAHQRILDSIAETWTRMYVKAATMKSDAFAAENEVRIWTVLTEAADPNSKLLYRPSGSFVVPYVKVELRDSAGLLPLTDIRIGPTRHPELAERSLCRLLGKLGCGGDVLITRSRVPLRA
jgi:hypothetical protein